MPSLKNPLVGAVIGGNAITCDQTTIGAAAITTLDRTSCRISAPSTRGMSISAACTCS
jgi:hypothetical protein